MKLILVAMFSLMAVSAEARTSWFCTADGYDGNNVLRSVSGEYMPTQREAERSAVSSCLNFGYMACGVRSCFEMPTLTNK